MECQKLNPGCTEMHQLLASLRLSQDRPADAKASLVKVVEALQDCDEDSVPTFHSQVELAKMLLEVELTKECKMILYTLLDVDEKDSFLWYLLGQCYLSQRNHRNAFKCLSKALQAIPDDADDMADLKADIAKFLQEAKDALGTAAADVDVDSDMSDSEVAFDGDDDDDDADDDDDDDDDDDEGQKEDSKAADA
eukprot:NODE_2393_length_792_cov_216.173620_g1665_i0.p1 GENE.NODE_2393_length_792_cov_216.173620_g1665_i0~~NODE_2393_length_792_cov_216.173620_g1665_i0.p1  ORF type:complete len:194 (-),score=88.43 NODE_2393_length_792_cov_216.173620_g1665_i0:57-638(-)